MADTLVLEANIVRCAGSSPVSPTNFSGSKYFGASHTIYWLIYDDKYVVVLIEIARDSRHAGLNLKSSELRVLEVQTWLYIEGEPSCGAISWDDQPNTQSEK